MIMACGLALTLQENLATEPSLTTTEEGWVTKDEIPEKKKRDGKKVKINPLELYDAFITHSV